ncbi:MAG: NADH-quinone oxidoreductase subunit C/D [Alphaproteobacteria bacterium]|uniref:NADH-quinone oxidoreductase subunit C/D n=1 Tax=Candidatus Nitrobium versatile TaxID=2884831 RepID=A0A953M111_9BACT|nr:NADH-quinone oxidoreductase subunit C/D [Candidatus Nitrobium versatile]
MELDWEKDEGGGRHPVNASSDIVHELRQRFGEGAFVQQETRDAFPTLWVRKEQAGETLRYLKTETERPYRMLYDLTAIDERVRSQRPGQPGSDFTVVYHLLSFGRNEDIRIKVPLQGEHPSLPSITPLWRSADWYEREVWDMFGIAAEGHPHLRRILMPPTWKGHPLRKEHPARRTEIGPYFFPERKDEKEEKALQFRPEEWGMQRHRDGTDFMFLNLGPHHTGTHGILRIVLELDGEEVVDAVLDIGFHHRAAEKMGERQTWHTFIPYTDRIDYLAGVLNNFPYVLAAEKLAGIEVPDRAKVIRVMLAELFRIASHLIWFGTFAQDLGQLSPVFYAFTDREHFYTIIEAICGFRMHPAWFRIGGVAADLPRGWEGLVRDFLAYLPGRLDEYDKIVMQNRIIKARTQGVGSITVEEAIEWGVTGPNLRACGFEWDFRKKRPYSGYEQFEFDIPTAQRGDSYDRAMVRIEEMRQSLRIVEQCLKNMPDGPFKADHPLTTPPIKKFTMQDIETLIAHFLTVSWGPVIPAGEASFGIESAKGNTTYYLISDGNTVSYRTRIRTPSFPHLQVVPEMTRGLEIADLIAILGSIDFIMGDVDR